jgi:hypothetical protein
MHTLSSSLQNALTVVRSAVEVTETKQVARVALTRRNVKLLYTLRPGKDGF